MFDGETPFNLHILTIDNAVVPSSLLAAILRSSSSSLRQLRIQKLRDFDWDVITPSASAPFAQLRSLVLVGVDIPTLQFLPDCASLEELTIARLASTMWFPRLLDELALLPPRSVRTLSVVFSFAEKVLVSLGEDESMIALPSLGRLESLIITSQADCFSALDLEEMRIREWEQGRLTVVFSHPAVSILSSSLLYSFAVFLLSFQLSPEYSLDSADFTQAGVAANVIRKALFIDLSGEQATTSRASLSSSSDASVRLMRGCCAH